MKSFKEIGAVVQNGFEDLRETVKLCWTGLISGWVTIWKSITPSTSTTNVVCGLSFSRSEPDFEGSLRALRSFAIRCVLRNSVSDCKKERLAGQILLTTQSEPIAILK